MAFSGCDSLLASVLDRGLPGRYPDHLDVLQQRADVESLPSHVPLLRRRKHHRVFASLFVLFVCLTLLLAKLNDATQYRSELTIQREREKQAVLEGELKRTLDTVVDSQMKLAQIKSAVDAHPPGPERAAMLKSLTEVQDNLQSRQNSMGSLSH